MRALSIRQPFAELILRGIKTVEYRSRATRIIGERFWIYAAMKRVLPEQGPLTLPSPGGRGIKADNIVVPREPVPEWMIELAEQVGMIEPDALLPRGVIVGSAVIERVSPITPPQANPLLGGEGTNQSSPTTYAWHLVDVQRATHLRKPRRHPQPAWFVPF